MYGQRCLYRLHTMWSSGQLRAVFDGTWQMSNLLWIHTTEDQGLCFLKKKDLSTLMLLSLSVNVDRL